MLRLDRAAAALAAGQPLTAGGIGCGWSNRNGRNLHGPARQRLHNDSSPAPSRWSQALPVGPSGPALCRLSRRGVGRAGIRRPRALRKAPFCFDSFQAGLSCTITHPAQARQLPARLRRFRAGEDRALTPKKVERLMQDTGVVPQPHEDRRHRALGPRLSPTSWRRARASRGCSGTSWAASRRSIVSAPRRRCRRKPSCRAKSPRELAGRGFKFVGPTIVYAFMQATGMVNDHMVTCHRHAPLAKLAGR